jgi:hypothetical protein
MNQTRLLPPARHCRPLPALAISAILLAASGPAFPAAAGAVGFIAGTITDSTTGDPIGNGPVQIWDDAGNFVNFTFSDLSGDYVTEGLSAGTYFVQTNNIHAYLDELYDDIPCPFSCDVTTGTPVAVTAGGTTSGIDFALDPGGAIGGTVTEAGTGLPLADAEVVIVDATGEIVSRPDAALNGNYWTGPVLVPGTYFAFTLNESSHLNELYDDIPCPYPSACDPTTGTPIPVTIGTTTSGIDFALAPGGAIAGSITDQATGDPLTAGEVDVFDILGRFVTSGSADLGGNYQSDDGLPTGTYYARSVAHSLHVNELYDDIPCPFLDCDPTTGTPIAVTVGATTGGIDFPLAAGGAIRGTVSEEGGPIPRSYLMGVEVGVFDAAGNLLMSSFSGTLGSWGVATPPGTYYARTLNGRDVGWANERYDNLPCLFSCPIIEATPITVVAGMNTIGVEFTLVPRPLYFDGFESGGLGIWPGVVGGTTCAHSMCTTGGPLTAGCDPCVAAICAVDPSCCNDSWNGLCQLEVALTCQLECP